ncbi:MAG: hypothetical protein ACOYNL_00255 [Rickettsiales bacterium]
MPAFAGMTSSWFLSPVPTNLNGNCHAIVMKLSLILNQVPVLFGPMAKTLKEFLEDRALWDSRKLWDFYKSLPSYKQYHYTIKTFLLAEKITGEGLHWELIMPRYAFWEAALLAKNLVGEAAKNMEPEVKALLANYPWNAPKRLRDIFTHFNHENRDESTDRILKELKRVKDYGNIDLGENHPKISQSSKYYEPMAWVKQTIQCDGKSRLCRQLERHSIATN